LREVISQLNNNQIIKDEARYTREASKAKLLNLSKPN